MSASLRYVIPENISPVRKDVLGTRAPNQVAAKKMRVCLEQSENAQILRRLLFAQ